MWQFIVIIALLIIVGALIEGSLIKLIETSANRLEKLEQGSDRGRRFVHWIKWLIVVTCLVAVAFTLITNWDALTK
ncbi:MAG: hypothetical protein AAGH92_03675 [Planctomycetota bacterium]